MEKENEKGIRVKYNDELLSAVKSCEPVILAITDEEERFIRDQTEIFAKSGTTRDFYIWDHNGGLVHHESGRRSLVADPRDVIRWFARRPKEKPDPNDKSILDEGPVDGSVLIMLDVLYYLQDVGRSGHSNPAVTRTIKTAIADLRKGRKALVMVGGREYIPPELEHHIAVIRFPLPEADYLQALIRRSCKWFAPADERNNQDKWLKLSLEEERSLATLLLGLRGSEAESILARACYENKKRRLENPDAPMEFDLETIRSSKVDSIRQNPALDITIPRRDADPRLTGLNMIGGAAELTQWFVAQHKLFNPEARLEGCDLPKGAVIFGPPGTGKDNVVERLAEMVGWTTLYADLQASKGELQGQSHRNFREIIQAAEAQSPCFLVLSEWEKQMAGFFAGSASCDGGVDMGIGGTFLNWMQRRKKPVFVWAITNGITEVPAAALRAGRFDEVWFMDLPREWEREEIFSVHLKIAGWDPVDFHLDLKMAARLTDGFSGGEIKKVVNKAIAMKYINDGRRQDGRFLTSEHLADAISQVEPAYRVRRAEVEAMREYAKTGGFPTANSKKPGQIVTSEPVRRIKIGDTIGTIL